MAALDIRIQDVRSRLQRIAVGHDERSIFVDFKGTDTVVNAKNPCRIQGDSTQGFVVVQPLGGGRSGKEGEIA